MNRIRYTVRPGDSLYVIAQRFGISTEELMTANNLTSPDIIPGQILEIPIEYYIVQAGDSLYSISQKFNVPIESIIELNNLENTSLDIGQRLEIPFYTEVIVNVDIANVRLGPGTNFDVIEQMERGARLPVIDIVDQWTEVELYDGREGWISNAIVDRRVHGGENPIVAILGYYTLEEGPALPSSYDSFVNNIDQLTKVGMFMFRISEDDPTTIEKFGEFTNQYVMDVIDIGHRNNVKMLALIHNLLYIGGVDRAKELTSQMLATEESRGTFIQNTIELVEGYGFDGVNIDIEDVNIEDSENLSLFYAELAEALSERGYYLSASVPSRVSDEPFNPFSDPFNYAAIGNVVDEFNVMLYNEHGWPGSGPGPVVSIGWMDRVLRYAISRVPKEKIMAAVSVFGFDFNLATGRSSYVTYDMAIELAENYGSEIIFDEETQTPYFVYTDEDGNEHEVWFENTQSIKAKIDLANELGINGIALWRLGMEDESMWNMIREDVVVKKF
ncbi:LysM peptidoglycan-binding domain-containing protein [Clostridium sp. D2Q-14]|uniref:glycosyl hydrolase family 18 protein n=1 Tax=Anaeromonas gelatinilytica TaxID=2683194 RepID=UPI00193BF0EA|nr:LysM peptidoglycan-binding domain-containing protein [Anaeromonas gelatinilytica]MBS4534063.1 LysM peptidoglycan-binding domain-containing protein [Anaeromonas gelatinilytica]